MRTLAKSVRRECETCKILTTKPYPVPNVGKLPTIRITAKYPFAVTGIDFVGPFTFKEKKQELKAYVIVFSCATSRGVHFTTTRTMETSEFIARLNEFIDVRSRPQEIVRSLRERHNVTKSEAYHPDIGEVVLVVSDSKNRHEWKHGLVSELLKGKDQVVRGVRMIVNNRIWERPVQLVCPLEIKSQMSSEELNKRIQQRTRMQQKQQSWRTQMIENPERLERWPR